MGLFSGAGRLIGNAIPFATQAVAAKNQGDMSRAILSLNQKREQQQEDLAQAIGQAQIGHFDAQAKSLDEGQWGTAFPATDETGQPVMVQQHKQTGELRKATIGGGAPPAPTQPSAPAPTAPPAAPMPSDSQDMGGGEPQVPTPPQQAASQAAPTAPTRVPVSSVLHPYVKPPATPPRIDPLSPAGITADSLKAAAVAGAQAPFKKDPNADPKDHFTFITTTDPTTGKTVVQRGNTATGSLESTGVQGKEASALGAGASLSPEDRLKMLNQAKLDNQTMKAYEAKVLSGQAKVGTAAGLAGASADAHGGVLNNMIGIAGNAATGAMDPEYQRYLTAQRSYGRIMGNLQSKRYTDHQAEIERSISGIQGNDLPGTIQYKQQLRDASLADPAIIPQGGGRGGGGTPAKDPAGNITLPRAHPAAVTPAERASLKQLGYTDAQINAIKP